MATANQHYAVITLENRTAEAMDVTVTIDFVDYFVINLPAGATTKQLSPSNASWRLSEPAEQGGDGRLAEPGEGEGRGVKMIERSSDDQLPEPDDDDGKGIKMIE